MVYQLKCALNTLLATNNTVEIFTVPGGAVVEVCSNEYNSGIVDVCYAGLVVAAFSSDLESRGERIN